MLLDAFTNDELQELLDAAKASLLGGKSVVTWTSLGSSATMQWDMRPVDTINIVTQELIIRGIIIRTQTKVFTGRLIH
jgi:hypothetical protein